MVVPLLFLLHKRSRFVVNHKISAAKIRLFPKRTLNETVALFGKKTLGIMQ
jgi:hypothetical protein